MIIGSNQIYSLSIDLGQHFKNKKSKTGLVYILFERKGLRAGKAFLLISVSGLILNVYCQGLKVGHYELSILFLSKEYC